MNYFTNYKLFFASLQCLLVFWFDIFLFSFSAFTKKILKIWQKLKRFSRIENKKRLFNVDDLVWSLIQMKRLVISFQWHFLARFVLLSLPLFLLGFSLSFNLPYKHLRGFCRHVGASRCSRSHKMYRVHKYKYKMYVFSVLSVGTIDFSSGITNYAWFTMTIEYWNIFILKNHRKYVIS